MLKKTLLGLILSALLAQASDDNFYANVVRLDNMLAKVHANYVREIPSDSLVGSAIGGMLGLLDKQTLYIDNFALAKSTTAGDADILPFAVRLDNSYLYVRIPEVRQGTPKKLSALLKEHNIGNTAGLILDLRYSTGGLLAECLGIAELMVPKSATLCSTRARVKGQNKTYKSGSKPVVPPQVRIFVLVNRYTAFGSELIAAAISDNNRGVLIGDTTAGEGKMASVLPLDKRYLLKMTTAHLYAPSGKCIDSDAGKGLAPTHVVASESSIEIKRILLDSREVHGFMTDTVIAAEEKTVDNLMKYLQRSLDLKEIASVPGVMFESVASISRDRSAYIKSKVKDIFIQMLLDEIEAQPEAISDLLKSLELHYDGQPESVRSRAVSDPAIVKALSLNAAK